jgi:phosphatidylethanolamine-binding protein (PEBP) family uncharacterized protein
MDDESHNVGDGAYIHWGVFNLSSNGLTSLPNNVDFSSNPDVAFGMVLGQREKYIGPCPPPETHIYKITIYALGSEMPLVPNWIDGMTRSRFERTYSSFILNKATLTGRFTGR